MNENALLERLARYGAGADTEGAVDRFSGDASFYEKYLTRFLANPDIVELGKAVAVKDAEKGQFHVHTLKRTAGNLGLTPLFDAAAEMNALFRSGEDERAFDVYENVKTHYDRVVTVIRGE